MTIEINFQDGPLLAETYYLYDVTEDNIREKLEQNAALIEKCHKTLSKNS